MTWIKIVRPEEADPSLLDLLQKTRAMYPPEYEVPVASIGEGESIVLSHTLIPQAMHHAFALPFSFSHPQDTAVQIHVVEVHPRQFHAPQAGGVEGFQ